MTEQDLRPILLAEDDDRDAQLTVAALSESMVLNPVDRVEDGVEVLDYLYRRGEYAGRTTEDPVVVLLDLKMPRKDGRDVLRELRAVEAFPHVPIVVLTSSREESDLFESYRLHANAYVVKPVDFKQFGESIRNLGLFWAVVNATPRAGGIA